MTGQETAQITATPAARNAIAALRAAQGPVMFVQSAGCCDGTVPMCFPLGEFATGDTDLLLGEIEGCPFYIDTHQYQALGRPRLVLDVEPGHPGGFSLAAGDGLYFVARGATTSQDNPQESGEGYEGSSGH
jgi:uncharacterized protein (DUF779 family)